MTALLLALAASAASPADDAIRAAATAANAKGTLYRVGLDLGHRVMIGSDRPFRVVEPQTGATPWKDTYTAELAFLADGGPEGEPASVFRIQVGAYGTQEAAEQERAALEKALGAPVVARFVPDRGSWRVRAGAAKDRAALAPLLAKLRDMGRKGIWIAEEPQEAPGPVTIRLVDTLWNTQLTTSKRLLAIPTDGGTLKVGGKPYRGVVEVRVDASGRLRAVDWVELESYLRGVVPSELGPEIWPQIEALKAQAVAARTYAMANAGQFEDEGFDICATPRCQAYGGAEAEHPLSDRAVSETRGEIASYEGKPIDALYTATCGGHTEDAKEIFPEQAAPYLVGVPCRAEGEALARTRKTVTGAAPAGITTESGEDVTRDAWLLGVSGVFGDTSRLAKVLAHPVSATTLRQWTAAVARLSGRPAPAGTPIAPSSLPKAALAIARDFAWDERARILLADADVDAVLRDAAIRTLPEDERRALVYLVAQGALHPAPDGRWLLEREPTGATLAAALARIGDAYDAFDLEEGTIVAVEGRKLQVARGKASASWTLADAPRLFTAAGTRNFPVASLALWPGDRVRAHHDGSGRVDFLELRPPAKGLSDDRSAAVYQWEVRTSGADLEAAINKRVSVGKLRDLRILKRGVSGRIVQIEVVGQAGSTVVTGFDVRNLLDLRESLTVIELQRDAGGAITAAVFAGKGWGHGVGLCQVGAYGMALRGASYREILEHYYPGIAISKSADGADSAH
ncbi:MAG TPA: SpoIID/LytB domain-containing protein [Candidatus Polarisedimenticolaceae bacterium]|nr:SpoIID/LytB domain-containing protein [Candidatus Polarisedimenticolaceae bacterium]